MLFNFYCPLAVCFKEPPPNKVLVSTFSSWEVFLYCCFNHGFPRGCVMKKQPLNAPVWVLFLPDSQRGCSALKLGMLWGHREKGMALQGRFPWLLTQQESSALGTSHGHWDVWWGRRTEQLPWMDVSLRLPDLLMPLSVLYIDVKLIVTIITYNI